MIGAGVTVSRQLVLMARGFDVTVFDRHRYAAMETSFANGGQLSASNAEVWNQADAILKGIKWMFQRSAAADEPAGGHQLAQVLVDGRVPGPRPQLSFQYYRHRQARHRCALAAPSACGDVQLRLQPEHRGILHFYSDEKEFAHARRCQLYAEGGLEHHTVTPEEVVRLSPRSLRARFVCWRLLHAVGLHRRYPPLHIGLADGIAKEGVQFKLGTGVERQCTTGRDDRPAWLRCGVGPELEDGSSESFDGVVVCAGVQTAARQSAGRRVTSTRSRATRSP